MLYNFIMVRYGELTLKGKNRRIFIDYLASNIKKALFDMKELKFDKQYDHLYIEITPISDIDEILSRLKSISGIHSFSLVSKVMKDLDIIKKTALAIIRTLPYKTFKVIASRADKTFPYVSDQINREVATTILKNTAWKVDVHQPDVKVRIEVRQEAAYLSIKNYDGLGGFPLGVSGKGLLMISGGIDSPVAGFMMMKKGVKIEAIHFSSPPYTSDMAIYKVKMLLQQLAKIQGEIRFINIPFTKLQLAIYEHCGDSYAITIMRRMMYRIASKFARLENCKCIINGESVGQVASQTLDSMKVINAVCSDVIIRPLAVFDKQEIISIAHEIQTYETSIMPYEDCCTIFDPKNPVTKPKLEECEFLEKKFDWEGLVNEAIENAVIETIGVE